MELKLPPENLFPDESHIELLERTLYRNWMEQWLKWNKWYYTVALGPDPTLHDLFNAPIVETKYRSTAETGTVMSLSSALSGRPMIW